MSWQAVRSRFWTVHRNAALEVGAYVSLVLVFFCDAFTPPHLSLEVGYEVPVAIAALSGVRMAVLRVAFAAVVANALGYLVDSPYGPQNDPISLQNRFIALASLVLVSALAIVVQRSSAYQARMEEQQRAFAAERELGRELERRGRRLIERQDVIGELVEAIAHDVRTPLEALSLTLKQALRGEYGELPGPYREVAQESRLSIGDITRLADTLLAVARFESQSATPVATSVEAAAVVRDLLNEFTPLADARDVALIHDVPPHAVVGATAGDLRRALANLVANAVRHTPAGGRVAIVAARDGDAWAIEVVDDGVGVAQSQIAHLFDRYTQGAGGTGLGLHIVKRIAESFGGSVSYAAVVPNGSRFCVRLPAWREVA